MSFLHRLLFFTKAPGDLSAEWPPRFGNLGGPLPWTVYLLFTALLLAGAWRLYRFEPEYLKARTRKILVTLRILSALCVLLVASGMYVEMTRSEPRRGTLLLLFDESESMNIADRRVQPEDVRDGMRMLDLDGDLSAADRQRLRDTTRHELVDRMVHKPDGFLAALESRYDLVAFSFGESSQATPLELGPGDDGRPRVQLGEPDQQATRLGSALRDAAGRLRGRHIEGVVLFTDGGNNQGEDPLRVAGDLHLPLMTVGVGLAEVRDIEVSFLERDAARAWWVAGGQADTAGTGLPLPSPDTPLMVRVVITSRHVSTWVGFNGDRFMHVVTQERGPERFAGPVQTLRLGRMNVKPGTEGKVVLDQDAPGGGRGTAVFTAPDIFQGPLEIPRPPDSYFKGVDWEESLAAGIGAQPFPGWVISGPFPHNQSVIPGPDVARPEGQRVETDEEWDGVVDARSLITGQWDDFVAHTVLRSPAARTELVAFEAMHQSEIFVNGVRVAGPLTATHGNFSRGVHHIIALPLQEGENLIAVRLFGRGGPRKFRMTRGAYGAGDTLAIHRRLIEDFPDDSHGVRQSLRTMAETWMRVGFPEQAANTYETLAERSGEAVRESALRRMNRLRAGLTPGAMDAASLPPTTRAFLTAETDTPPLLEEGFLRDSGGVIDALLQAITLLEGRLPELEARRMSELVAVFIRHGVLSEAESLLEELRNLDAIDPAVQNRIAAQRAAVRDVQATRPSFPVAPGLEMNLVTAERLAGDGDLEQASVMFQRMFTEAPDAMFQADANRFLSIPDLVSARMRDIGPELIAAHRTRFDPEIRARLEEAIAHDQVEALHEIARHYRLTRGAGEALSHLSHLALRDGNPHLAHNLVYRLLVEHAGDGFPLPLMVAKAADTLAMAGDLPGALELLGRLENTSFSVRGTSWTPESFSRHLRERHATPPASTPATAAFSTPYDADPRDTLHARQWWPHPFQGASVRGVVDKDRVFLNTRRHTQAFSAKDGRPLWATDSTLPHLATDTWQPFRGHLGEDPASRGLTDGFYEAEPAVHGETVFSRVHRRGPRRHRAESADWVLEARDAETGALRWSTEDGHPLSRMEIISSPTVTGGNVFAVGRDTTRMNPSFEVVSLRADTGALLWRTPVGSVIHDARASEDMFHKWIARAAVEFMGPPAVTGGSVYVATGYGAVAALSSGTGKIHWVHAYVPDTSNHIGRREQKLRYLRTPEVLVHGDRLVVAPRDTLSLLCLRTDNGRALWRRPMTDIRELAGLAAVDGQQHLIAQGIALEALSLETGARRWRVEPDETTGAFMTGALLHAEQLWVPGEKGLRVLNLNDGTAKSFTPWPQAGSHGPLSNLFSDGASVFGFSEDRLVRLGGGNIHVVESPRVPEPFANLFPIPDTLTDDPRFNGRLAGGRAMFPDIPVDDPAKPLARVGEELLRLDLVNRRVLWRVNPGFDLREARVAGDRLLLRYDEKITAHDMSTGARLWTRVFHPTVNVWERLQNRDHRTHPRIQDLDVLGDKGLVFQEDRPHVFSLQTGEALPSPPPPEGYRVRSGVLTEGGVALVLEQRNQLSVQGLNFKGESTWSISLPGGLSLPELYRDGEHLRLLTENRFITLSPSRQELLTSLEIPHERAEVNSHFRLESGHWVLRRYNHNRKVVIRSFVFNRQGDKLLLQHPGDVRVFENMVIGGQREGLDNPGNLVRHSGVTAYGLEKGERLWTSPGPGFDASLDWTLHGNRVLELVTSNRELAIRVLNIQDGSHVNTLTLRETMGRSLENLFIGGTVRYYEPRVFDLPGHDRVFLARKGELLLATDHGIVSKVGAPSEATPRATPANAADMAEQAVRAMEPLTLPGNESDAKPLAQLSGNDNHQTTIWGRQSDDALYLRIEARQPRVSIPAPGAPPTEGDSLLVGLALGEEQREPNDDSPGLPQRLLFSVALSETGMSLRNHLGAPETLERLDERLTATVERDGDTLHYALRIPFAMAEGGPSRLPERLGIAVTHRPNPTTIDHLELGAGLTRGFAPHRLVPLRPQPSSE
ncbi:MAG: PQQ-binding-like beta-propeller repeat protein [Verrucomicrobia bacterium]|nr:PQQ-binding-like beta-propeller repeat protein [Verrucomicrobiota bacterium]MCH8511809.1 PQQ-binding-like beta-propeller repeat protein [Kiritimatiellia bacterium]